MKIKEQEAILKEYNVKYEIRDGVFHVLSAADFDEMKEVEEGFLQNAVFHSWASFNGLTLVSENFLKNCTFNHTVFFNSLTFVPENFLRGCLFNSGVYFDSLTIVPEKFLQGCFFGGHAFFDGLITVSKNFLKGCFFKGIYWLSLNSLSKEEQEKIRENLEELEEGYYADRKVCYYDGILRDVLSVKHKGEYTIYKTPFDYVVVKGDYSAHSETIRKGIEDVEYKILSERLKKEPLNLDDLMTVEKYRLITGACDLGCRRWMESKGLGYEIVDGKTIEKEPIKVKELVEMMEKEKPYGYEKIIKLIKI